MILRDLLACEKRLVVPLLGELVLSDIAICWLYTMREMIRTSVGQLILVKHFTWHATR